LETEPTFRTRAGLDEKSCEMVASVSLMLGKTLAGLRVWDVMRTLDYIRTRAEAMTEKIACVGLSGGGSTTLYATALDERIRLAVIAGAFCTYRASIMSIVHCPDNYVPGILRYGELADVAGLIAPRPLLIEHGTQDPIFPIAGVRQAYRDLKRVYSLLECADHLENDYFPGGHQFGGRKTFQWLDQWFAQD
jgi:predicted esterase